MKPGDLVKMKYDSWWKVRNRSEDYTNQMGLVYSIHARGIKVLMPDGKIKVGLVDQWEIVSSLPDSTCKNCHRIV